MAKYYFLETQKSVLGCSIRHYLNIAFQPVSTAILIFNVCNIKFLKFNVIIMISCY